MVLYGHHLNRPKNTLDERSEDFWQHFRVGSRYREETQRDC